MTRMVYAVAVALLGCWANPAGAETLPTFVDVPATYTPGTPFSFDVLVPALTDFKSFSVEVVFATDTLDPSLFVSSVAPATAPGGRYVFPSNANFQSSIHRATDSNLVSLFFSGSTGTGVLVEPGTNDTLARVTVEPGTDLTGPITISLGEVVFDRNMEAQFNDPTPITIAQADTGPGTNPVPAPAGAVLLGLGGLLLGVRNRLARRA